MTCDKKCCTTPLTLKDAKIGMKLKCINPTHNEVFGADDIYEITDVQHGFVYIKNLTKNFSDTYGGWNCDRFVEYKECDCNPKTPLALKDAKDGLRVMCIDQEHSSLGMGKVFTIIPNDGRVMCPGYISIREIKTGYTAYGWSPERFYSLDPITPTPEKIMDKVNSVEIDREAMTRDNLVKMIAAVGKHFTGPVDTASKALLDLLEKSPVDSSVQGRHTVIILPTVVPIIGVATCHSKEDNKPQVGERLALRRALYHFFGHAGCVPKTPSEVRAEWLQKEINRLRRELNAIKK